MNTLFPTPDPVAEGLADLVAKLDALVAEAGEAADEVKEVLGDES